MTAFGSLALWAGGFLANESGEGFLFVFANNGSGFFFSFLVAGPIFFVELKFLPPFFLQDRPPLSGGGFLPVAATLFS